MAMGKGLAQFAAGFGKGYMDGLQRQRQQKQEDEKHAAEMQRLQLENQKLQDFQNARDEIKALGSTSDKPTAAFVVQSPAGQMVYTDEKLAKAHAANDPSAQVTQGFVVNGQVFHDQHDAEQAAARMSTPAAMLAREVQVYKKYGMVDQANATLGLYQKELETNRQALQQAFLDAQSQGDIKAAVDLYNNNLLNGAKAEVQQGPNGEIVVTRTRAGQPLGQPTVFKSADEFWTKTADLVSKAPANLFESVKFDKEFGLKQRGVAVQERGVAVQEGQLKNDTQRTGATVRHLDAQTADIPLQAADRRTQAGAAATSAGAAATNAQTGVFSAQTARAHALTPQVSAVPGQDGGLNFVTIPRSMAPDGSGMQLGAPQVTPVQGLRYPAIGVAEAKNAGLNGLLGGAAPGAAPFDPDALVKALRALPPRGQPAPGRVSSGRVQ